MKPIKVALIGGGSYIWTSPIVKDLAVEKDLDGIHICLMDIDPVKLELTVPLCKKIIELANSKTVLTSTTSLEEALDGADFVVVSISTGGLEAMRHDVEIPQKYGIYQSVGDTVGPGGISRALRNIPVFLDLARNMERLCPNAWMVHVTNPLTTITRAVAKETSIKVVGLCHGYAGTRANLAKMFGVDFEDVSANVVGINHLIWLADLRIKGKDVLPLLTGEKHDQWLKQSRENNLTNTTDDDLASSYSYKLNFELIKRYGILPGNYQSHVAEFFPYFLKDRKTIDQYKIKMKTIESRYEWQEKAKRKIEGMLSGEIPIELERSRELVADVIHSLVSGKTRVDIVNIPNIGQISNLPLGAVVETNVKIDSSGVVPVTFGELPKPLHGLIAPIVDSQELTVEAAVEGNKEKVLQAFLLDPLTNNYDTMECMLDEMLNANRAYLPQFFR